MMMKKGLVAICMMSLVLLTTQCVIAENLESQGNGEEDLENSNMDQTMEQTGENYMYNWRHQYRIKIQEGIENKSVTMECNISEKAGKMYINSYEYEKGMNVEIKAQSQHKLEIKVTAEFKEGKVLVLNIDGSAFMVKNSQQLKIKFDGKEIEEDDVNEIIHGNSTQAKYATAIGEDGGQYLVYIPHFSEHILTLEILDPEEETTNYLLAAFGAGLLTILVLVLIVVGIGKFKE